jgi:hemin uptake protein HemP
MTPLTRPSRTLHLDTDAAASPSRGLSTPKARTTVQSQRVQDIRATPLSEAAPVPAGAVASESLLQGKTHVSIMHNGETYQLRATRLGKLILTK